MEHFPDIMELITAISLGKETAFRQLFDQYKDRVFSTAYAYTESRADAEEIVQEVFLRIWKNREKLPQIEIFPAWLHTITRNRCLSALKKKALEEQRRREVISNLTVQCVVAEAASQEKEMQSILQSALNDLSPQQRKVFIMSRLQGLDRKTIAQRLELAPATVSVHLTIALKAVKNYLMKSMNGVAGFTLLCVLLHL